MAETEKKPHSGAQRGTRLVEAPRAQRRLYHSRAAHEEWDGAFPLSEDTSGSFTASRVEPWDVYYASPLT